MTWSLREARPSAPDLTRKSVRRAVVRPLEALLDPLPSVADGLDDDGHFCTHFGSSFLWGELWTGSIASHRREPVPKTAVQLEMTVSRPFAWSTRSMDGVGVAGGPIGVYRPEDRF